MFIELTDHLRCPAAHDEAFLVLLPEQMRGRTVLQGRLGCPVCHREYPVRDAVLHFGEGPPAPAAGTVPPAEALRTFLGLEGPGGFMALVGSAGAAAATLTEVLPGVHLVAVNPPVGVVPGPAVSVVRSPSPPLKARSCRGLVLGHPEAGQEAWAPMLGVVLPGLRATGQGAAPSRAGFDLLASADGWWVGRVG